LPAAANGYQAPTTTMSAADTPDGFLPPKIAAADTPDGYAAPTTMSAADTPDGYVTPSKAKPAMSATDSPDGYVTPSKPKPAMSATDSPDGYVPVTDSPDGNVPASDSPDGYAVPFKKPKLDVQSFEEMVPRPVLDMLSPVVKSLCAKTRFHYTCEMSIAKLPETTVVPARQKDGLGVLNLAIDAVRAKIMEATKVAKDMTADPRVDQITKSAIKDCITLYDDVKTSYDTGLAALKRGDKSTATTAFDSARTYVDTCDNGFLDRPALKPVIAGQEKILAELSSNVLAINKYM
jgi:pectinesterase inhibitor-like protein